MNPQSNARSPYTDPKTNSEHVRDAGESIEKLASPLVAKSEELLKSTQKSIEHASSAMSTGYKAARREISKASGQVENLVKTNPFSSVAIAAGLGWLMGRFLNPTRKHN